MDESRPIFMQIAEQIENDIIAGVLARGGPGPLDERVRRVPPHQPGDRRQGREPARRRRESSTRREGSACSSPTGARERLVASAATSSATSTSARCSPRPSKLGITATQLAAMIHEGRIAS